MIIKKMKKISHIKQIQSHFTDNDIISKAQLHLDNFNDLTGRNSEEYLFDVVTIENETYLCESHFFIWIGEGQRIEKKSIYVKPLIKAFNILGATTEFHNRAALIMKNLCLRKI